MLARSMAVLLCALAAAGCVAGDPALPQEPEAEPQSTDGPFTTAAPEPEPKGSAPPATATPTPSLPPPGTPGRFELSQCTGFRGGTNAYPAAAAPGHAPPGWEPGPADPVSFVLMAGYECSRIGAGPYERGPVHLLWDAHGRARIPAACLEGRAGPTTPAVLNVLLVDDVEVAAYLNASYGVPTAFAEFEVASAGHAPAVAHTWSWRVPGGEWSGLTVWDDGTASANDMSERLFWARGDGLGQLDLTYERTSSDFTDRGAAGTMRAPMLLAETPQQAFAGPTSFLPAMAGTGQVTWYSDRECVQAEPVP